MRQRISVILPTYNEAGHIVELIKEIFKVTEKAGLETEIVLVDDNSSDRTAGIVEESFKNNSSVKIYIRKNERGLATAIKFGIEKADGEILVFMDTDFNHDPQVIPMLIYQLTKFDIAVGSRFVAGGGMKGSQFRYWGSYIFNAFVKLILQIKTNDNLCGFFATSRRVINSLNRDKIFTGYGDYFIRFLYEAAKKRLSIIEVPVIYQERHSGRSKTNFLKHLLCYIMTVLKIRAGK